MKAIRVTYDPKVNAAYLYLTDPKESRRVTRMYACDPIEARGMINMDFDENDHLIGVEVLAANSMLSEYILESAEILE
ncbi:DUF2283 domain-containing protein [Streptosporangium sp. NBC_01639]|uniref:DUF2283 domain-containing protein n=1 Tax=Streptosporangium sp. NBC_01639 TaxID=2975948 RepID=UPI0038679333|nr:DUF2283 domain-containing protein [Streptosporangium sp. NBC_01639]